MFNTNLLEAARISKVKKLVYTSSIGAYSSAEVFMKIKIEMMLLWICTLVGQSGWLNYK